MEEASQSVHDFLQGWEVFDVTAPTVAAAAQQIISHQLSYWDAQIWATARLNQIPFVLSEDFQDDQA